MKSQTKIIYMLILCVLFLLLYRCYWCISVDDRKTCLKKDKKLKNKHLNEYKNVIELVESIEDSAKGAKLTLIIALNIIIILLLFRK